MGRCEACGRRMQYYEFEQHLEENPKCAEIVEKLRKEGKKSLEEVLEDEDISLGDLL